MDESMIKQLAFYMGKNDMKFRLNEEYLRAIIDIHRFIHSVENFNEQKKKIYEEIVCPAFEDIDNVVSFDEAINIFNKTVEKLSNKIDSLYSNSIKYIDSNDLTNDIDDIVIFNPHTDIDI